MSSFLESLPSSFPSDASPALKAAVKSHDAGWTQSAHNRSTPDANVNFMATTDVVT